MSDIACQSAGIGVTSLLEEVAPLWVLGAETPARPPLRQAADADEGCSEPALSRPVELALAATSALILAAVVVHVALVFLYVAPANTVSRRYQSQINAWVSPYFEQDWRLFAPDPQSVRQQVWARTETTAPSGTQVGEWIDLTAIDDAAVRHDPFPSHTSQNMMRRALGAYRDSTGTDDQSSSRWARMVQEYLRNIAVQRVAARGQGVFDAIQLRIVSTPIPPPELRAAGRHPAESPSTTRVTPWWQVTSHEH